MRRIIGEVSPALKLKGGVLAAFIRIRVATGPDACRLDAAFSADEVVITQKGPCGGAKLGGWWKRDQTRDPEGELF